VNDLVLCLLEKEPDNRMESMRSLVEELQQLNRSHASEDESRPTQSKQTAIIPILIGLVCIFAGFLIVNHADNKTVYQKPKTKTWHQFFELKGPGRFVDLKRTSDSSLQASTLKLLPVQEVNGLAIVHHTLNASAFKTLIELPFAKLTGLRLERVGLQPGEFAALSRLTDLTQLYIADETLSSKDVDAWSTLRKLENLHFYNCDFDGDVITSVVKNLPGLVRLELNGDLIDAKDLKKISKMSLLENLELGRIQLDDDALSNLSGMSKLVILDLNENGLVTEGGIKILLSQNPNLSKLILKNCRKIDLARLERMIIEQGNRQCILE
jgi:hypothetical protein